MEERAKRFRTALDYLKQNGIIRTQQELAASLDIPKETIARALGHGGHSVTDIYIDFDQLKVDDANRRVIDWVLYGRK